MNLIKTLVISVIVSLLTSNSKAAQVACIRYFKEWKGGVRYRFEENIGIAHTFYNGVDMVVDLNDEGRSKEIVRTGSANSGQLMTEGRFF